METRRLVEAQGSTETAYRRYGCLARNGAARADTHRNFLRYIIYVSLATNSERNDCLFQWLLTYSQMYTVQPSKAHNMLLLCVRKARDIY